MNQRGKSRSFLKSIGAGPEHNIDIAGAALNLAALKHATPDIAAAEKHLNIVSQELSVSIAVTPVRTATAAATALANVIAHRYHYRGDDLTYDDLHNADLISVIQRRKGLPVALGILYIHVARNQNWIAFGLNFPGHFLVGLEHRGERVIVDPFHAGVTRTPAELRELLKLVAGQDAELNTEMFLPLPDRNVLLRLQSNIRLRLFQMRRLEEAAETIESMLMIAPEHHELWHELGLLYTQLSNFGAAIEALGTAAKWETDQTRIQEIQALSERLRQRLN